ncbi:hypothetical protein CALCODRAFT_518785 [Calocera cornea HHB12733]|uniref:Uncharacterized protein n=1 Tax=Calocera cornea HHB12733 TaxID=1353952 RepID=A0A165ESA2_9BASI|nr:hypothetical protein CALCODRAFT_518785 [Calocera cornea HHB12733]
MALAIRWEELVDDGWFPPVFEYIAPFESQRRYTYDRAFQDMLQMKGIRDANKAQRDWADHVLAALGRIPTIEGIDVYHMEVSTMEPDDEKMAHRWWRTLALGANAMESRILSSLYQENAEIEKNSKAGERGLRQKINIPEWVEEFHQLRDLHMLSSPGPYMYNGSRVAIMIFQRPWAAGARL